MTIKRKTPLARSGRIKPKKRKPSEFARIYGSRARVEWVKTLPCVVSNPYFCRGSIENAHIETGGTGRKADADKIVPACKYHHDMMHDGIRTFIGHHPGLQLRRAAARVEAMWQERLAGVAA